MSFLSVAVRGFDTPEIDVVIMSVKAPPPIIHYRELAHGEKVAASQIIRHVHSTTIKVMCEQVISAASTTPPDILYLRVRGQWSCDKHINHDHTPPQFVRSVTLKLLLSMEERRRR